MSFTLDPVIRESRHHPLGNRITVEVPAPEETGYRGLIHVPDNAKDAPLWGTVLAVGSDFQVDANGELTPDDVVVAGDRVLFARYGGHQIELANGRKLVYLDQSDVLAKLIPTTENAHVG